LGGGLERGKLVCYVIEKRSIREFIAEEQALMKENSTSTDNV